MLFFVGVKDFLKKHNFTLRKISHIGQSLSNDYEKKLAYFIEEINKRKVILIW